MPGIVLISKAMFFTVFPRLLVYSGICQGLQAASLNKQRSQFCSCLFHILKCKKIAVSLQILFHSSYVLQFIKFLVYYKDCIGCLVLTNTHLTAAVDCSFWTFMPFMCYC